MCYHWHNRLNLTRHADARLTYHIILTFFNMTAYSHWSPQVPVILPSFHPLIPLPFHLSINVNQSYLFSGCPVLPPSGSGFVWCMCVCARVCAIGTSLLKPLISQPVCLINLNNTVSVRYKNTCSQQLRNEYTAPQGSTTVVQSSCFLFGAKHNTVMFTGQC